MFRNCFVCILSCFLSAGIAIADSRNKTATEVPATPSQPAQQDFGKGFALLFKMGLPRLEGAKPAVINIYSSPASIYEYGMNTGDDKNISWIKAPDKNTDPALCIIGGVFECKLYNRAALAKMQAEMQAEMRAEKAIKDSNKKLSSRQTYSMMISEDNYFCGEWEIIASAKAADDIKKTLQDKNSQYIFRSDKLKYGLFLLQAAQLYESGAKSEANEIARLLFKAGGSKEVLQSALNALAESKYLRAYCDFLESKDWGKFSAELEKIIGKFKNNWDNERYVKAVQVAVAARAGNTEPPELKTSIPLTAADRELIAQLSKMTQEDYDGSGLDRECWLFPDNASKDKADADKDQKKINALDKIRAGGIKSVPLLIAMLDDEWLLPRGYYNRTSRGEERSDEEQTAETKPVSLFEAADHLEMPMTRAKLAEKLLIPLIIPENKDQEYEISGKKGDELKAMCLAWYESVKALDTNQLQKKYLAEGTESQKALVVENMIVTVDDATAPMIEKALLESERNMMNQDLLTRYCEIRKDKAKPFIGKLRTKCYQQLDEQYSTRNMGQGASESKAIAKKALDQFFDQLDQSKPPALMEDVAKELLAIKDETEFNYIAPKFARAAKGQPIEKVYQICFDTAVLAKTHKQKFLLLCLPQMRNQGRQKSKVDITKFKTPLEKLLDDQSEVPEMFGEKQTVSLLTAAIIQSVSEAKPDSGDGDDSDMRGQPSLYGTWGDKYAQYLVRRAKMILAGTTVDKLSKLVNADELNDSRINDAKAKIAGKSEAEIKALCGKSQLNELIPLSVAIQKNKQLNSKLLLLANQIVETNTDIPGLKEQVAKFKGKALNEQLLQEIIKLAEKRMQDDKAVDISLQRRSCLEGVVLKISSSENESGMGNAKRNYNDADIRMFRVYLSFGDDSSANMRKVIPAKKKATEKNLDQALSENTNHVDAELSNESVKEQEKKFMETFNTEFLKEGNALWAGKIIISGVEY